MRVSALLFSLALLSAPLVAEEETSPMENKEFVINLKDPVFTGGVITTDQGGVITTEGMRIQARQIAYTNKVENGHLVQRIVAEGDLMMEYGGRAFVGEKLEYDFVTRTGSLTNGRTSVDLWFIGGEKIVLEPDGSYLIYNAFLTTSESQDNAWEVSTGLIKITKEHLLSAKNIRFQFFKVPVFWLPSFKSNLKWLRDPPIRYKMRWDKGIGPRVSMRYRIYSWEDFNLFLRLDYRITKGPGAAIEGDYHAPDGQTTFLMKNYGAFDKVIPGEHGLERYRLQGLFDTKSRNERTELHFSYDKMSDDKMPVDFKSDDFEVNTQKRTFLRLSHEEDNAFGNLRVQPRINRFQSLNQELPLISMGIRPFGLGNSGIISQNYVNAGYLDYVYASDLQSRIRSRDAIRLETNNFFYRPIKISPITVTPKAGLIGLFYSNNPIHNQAGQLVGSYGGDITMQGVRQYSRYKHLMTPYATYIGLTHPTLRLDDHFIFNIDDGLFQLNTMRFGLRNAFIKRDHLLPTVIADFSTDGYLHSRSTHKTFPKAYANLELHKPSFALRAGLAWNIDHNVLDYSNLRGDITFNEDVALSTEFRHRSRFDWRKGDHQNFIVDVARSLDNLLDSPLSDGRNTLLIKFQTRFTPRVTANLQTHSGWGRRFEPRYNSANLNLFVLLAASWMFRGTLSYTKESGISPSVSLMLVK